MKKHASYEETEALLAKKGSASADRTWLTHISILVDTGSAFHQLCGRCLQQFLGHFSLSIDDIEIIHDLHLSLSEVFTLRYADIHPFIRLLNDALRHYQQRFTYKVMSKYRLLPNKEGNYVYLAVLVDCCVAGQLILDINSVLHAFNLPGYHEDDGPTLHISIARCLTSMLSKESIGGEHTVPASWESSQISTTTTSWKSSAQDRAIDGNDNDGADDEVEMMFEDAVCIQQQPNSASALDLLLDYTDCDDNEGNKEDKQKTHDACLISAVQKSCLELSLQVGDRVFIKQLTSSSLLSTAFIERN